MFKVIGDKIYFKDILVAEVTPGLRHSIKCDFVDELERHVSVLQVEKILARVHRLEKEIRDVPIEEYLNAR